MVLPEVSIIGKIKIELQLLVRGPEDPPGSISVHEEAIEEMLNLHEPVIVEKGWIMLARVIELELLEKQLGAKQSMSDGLFGRFDA